MCILIYCKESGNVIFGHSGKNEQKWLKNANHSWRQYHCVNWHFCSFDSLFHLLWVFFFVLFTQLKWIYKLYLHWGVFWVRLHICPLKCITLLNKINQISFAAMCGIFSIPFFKQTASILHWNWLFVRNNWVWESSVRLSNC